MTWTALTYAFGSKLTSTKMTQNQDNFTALCNKDAGAPVLANDYIETAMIAAAQVSQSKLKTSSGTVTGTGGTTVLLTLPGGEYGFYPQHRSNSPSGGQTISSQMLSFDSISVSTGFVTYITLSASGSPTASAQQRYVSASPPYAPYRAGDFVPLFIMAAINKTTGAVGMLYIAPDPPWANNGPTPINAFARLVALARSRVPVNLDTVKKDRAEAVQFETQLADLYAFMNDPKNAKMLAAELSKPLPQEIKNADMVLIPHPFLGNDLSNYQIVAIAPTDAKFCHALAARHEFLGDSIADIVLGDYLIIDNAPMPGLQTPAGVSAVNARWRLTP